MNDAKNEYLALQTIISLLKSDLDKDIYNQIQKYINTLIKLSAKINKLPLHDKVIAKKDNIVTKHIAWRLYDLIKENIDKKQNQDNVINIIERESRRISIYNKSIKKGYKSELYQEDILLLLAKYFTLNEMDYKCAYNYKSLDNNLNDTKNIIRIPNVEEYSRIKYSY